MTYDGTLKTPAILALGNDYRGIDGGLDFGMYGEVGVEMDLSSSFGISLADRYIDANTRPLDTLKKQMVHYAVNIYSLSLFTHF